jgi:hypothetical protein
MRLVETLKPYLSRLYPIEVILLVQASLVLAMAAFTPLRLYTPAIDWTFAQVIIMYGLPMVLGFLLMQFVKLKQKRGLSGLLQDLMLFSRILFSVILIICLMQNCKLWSQLIHDEPFDAVYHAIDQQFQWLMDWVLATKEATRPPDFAYYTVYFLLFYIDLMVAAWHGHSVCQRIGIYFGCSMALGGFAYMIAPAYGPFALPDDPFLAKGLVEIEITEFQQQMLAFTERFRASGGEDYQPKDFMYILGAMPSLHVAHVWVAVLCVWRYSWSLGFINLLMALWITYMTVATRMHYLVDILGGLLVLALTIWLAEWMLKRWGIQDKKPA